MDALRRVGVGVCPVMHVQDDEIDLYIQGKLQADRASVLEAHFGSCNFCENRLVDTRTFIERLEPLSDKQQPYAGPSDRRKNARVLTDEVAVMRVLQPELSEHLEVTVLN